MKIFKKAEKEDEMLVSYRRGRYKKAKSKWIIRGNDQKG